jgi:hypothetical protein
MDRTIPAHIAAEMDEYVRTGLDVTAATLRVWVAEIEKHSLAQDSALVSEQIAHAKHKELLRKVAHCSDMFADFREDIWGELRDFYRENC